MKKDGTCPIETATPLKAEELAKTRKSRWAGKYCGRQISKMWFKHTHKQRQGSWKKKKWRHKKRWKVKWKEVSRPPSVTAQLSYEAKAQPNKHSIVQQVLTVVGWTWEEDSESMGKGWAASQRRCGGKQPSRPRRGSPRLKFQAGPPPLPFNPCVMFLNWASLLPAF